MNIKLKIKHPEWLKHSTCDRTLNLVRNGKCPESIAGWMLVVSLKHPLRAVYGSDLKAAWALLKTAIWDVIYGRYTNLLYWLKIKKLEDFDDCEQR